MAKLGWLTPDTIPTETICRTLTIPANFAGIVACVSGALYPLTLAENWEKFGAIEPEAIAAAMQTMYLDWLYQSGECSVPDVVPVGAMVMWLASYTSVPDKWHRANGNILAQADYPELYALIGGTYDTTSPGAGNFMLPDMRGRTPLGEDGSIGALGTYLGAATHTLTTSEMPAHNHAQRGNVAGSGSLTSVISQNANPTGVTAVTTTSNAGGGGAHNNIQPSLICNYIIKVLP